MQESVSNRFMQRENKNTMDGTISSWRILKISFWDSDELEAYMSKSDCKFDWLRQKLYRDKQLEKF